MQSVERRTPNEFFEVEEENPRDSITGEELHDDRAFQTEDSRGNLYSYNLETFIPFAVRDSGIRNSNEFYRLIDEDEERYVRKFPSEEIFDRDELKQILRFFLTYTGTHYEGYDDLNAYGAWIKNQASNLSCFDYREQAMIRNAWKNHLQYNLLPRVKEFTLGTYLKDDEFNALYFIYCVEKLNDKTNLAPMNSERAVNLFYYGLALNFPEKIAIFCDRQTEWVKNCILNFIPKSSSSFPIPHDFLQDIAWNLITGDALVILRLLILIVQYEYQDSILLDREIPIPRKLYENELELAIRSGNAERLETIARMYQTPFPQWKKLTKEALESSQDKEAYNRDIIRGVIMKYKSVFPR